MEVILRPDPMKTVTLATLAWLGGVALNLGPTWMQFFGDAVLIPVAMGLAFTAGVTWRE